MSRQFTSPQIFTSNDLKANKAGLLTAGQKLQIDKQISFAKSSEKFVGAFIFIIFIGMFCAAYFSDTFIRYQINNFTFTGIIWIFTAFIFPWGLYFIIKKKYKIPEDQLYKVYSITGAIKKVKGDSESASYLKVNKTNLYIDDIVYDIIEDDKKYTFYYIESSSWKTVLSWEKI